MQMGKDETISPSLPLKWHGGKHYLATAIIRRFPSHVHYVEPFFGGGAVLFAKPDNWIEGHSEIVNDVNGDLVNFWTVLRNKSQFAKFKRAVEATPFSKPGWLGACNYSGRDPVERAVAIFVRFRQSRQGLGRDFATMSRNRTRRKMNEQASAWISAIDGLSAAHARLQRVVIYDEDAVSVIRREDGENTFFYLDPPYLHETRTVKSCYQFEMDHDDHAQLLELLGNVKGKFLLSGYPSKLYREACRSFKWKTQKILIDNKASSSKIKPRKTEFHSGVPAFLKSNLA
jgi:DNA adenine methylase